MANSGKKINYNIRPAKSVERKMIRDMLLRLFPFGIFTDYQYIGFGSKYFIDFKMIHKYLHINKMISIEGDSNNRERYFFNRPYDCIDIHFGHSTEILPKLNLAAKSIVWLDYDEAFCGYMLGDLSTLVEKLPSGSIIYISYNSHPYNIDTLKSQYNDISSGYYKRKFEDIFGEEFIPTNFDERGWSNKVKFSKFIRNVIFAQVNKILFSRNSFGKEKDERISAKQVVYFDYQDNAHMSTVGFLLLDGKDLQMMPLCNLNELDFYKDDSESYKIEVPNLTGKEIRYLMENMPENKNLDLERKIFNEKDVINFKNNYKYYPSFYEVDYF